jgi:SNF2 family DNA or RNA helicase
MTSLKCTDIVDGSMSQKDRQKVVEKIKTDKETRIILMSFKAGGVGELTSCGRRSA